MLHVHVEVKPLWQYWCSVSDVFYSAIWYIAAGSTCWRSKHEWLWLLCVSNEKIQEGWIVSRMICLIDLQCNLINSNHAIRSVYIKLWTWIIVLHSQMKFIAPKSVSALSLSNVYTVFSWPLQLQSLRLLFLLVVFFCRSFPMAEVINTQEWLYINLSVFLPSIRPSMRFEINNNPTWPYVQHRVNTFHGHHAAPAQIIVDYQRRLS